MKIYRLIYPAITLLLALVALASDAPTTKSAQRSCCAHEEIAAKPLLEKSLYQLSTVWTNDSGAAVKLEALRGRPQVVAMFFSSCQYTCPLLVSQMKQMEANLPSRARTNIGFTLVSFDSQRDTPGALNAYRAQHELARDYWTLLQGDPDGVLDLAQLLGVKFKQDTQGNFSHSNLITLLNAEGEIVYQQVGLTSDNRELVRHIEQLQKN